jgi:hypothetical protein
VADEHERIVFTNAIDSGWRPASPHRSPRPPRSFCRTHPDGTDYRITVRHGDPADRARHAELGFTESWGTTADQLARLVEGEAGR